MNKYKVKIGQAKNKIMQIISKNKRNKKIIKSKKIKNDFIKIPIITEKTIKSFLYSFFQGLK